MRIGIDARFFGGEQSKGLGRYTQKLIEYLAKHDNENEYVVFLQEDGFNNWYIENENFIPVLAPYKWYTIAEQVFMPLKIRAAKVDFMHFPHFNVPLFYRKPFIVTIHDLIINHFPTERATTLGPWLYKIKQFAGQLVMKHAVNYASTIITVSEFSKEDITNYYNVQDDKIVVTYEAADPELVECTEDRAATLMKQYGIEKPYLLYVGNAYPHKNLERLIEAVKTMKDKQKELPWQLVLVGKEDYFYSRLKQEAWAHNVDAEVVFTGFVSDADLPCFYQYAQAYIFPSLYEGFGLPPLEAMSYGTPVLSAKASCLPEVLGDAALYFDPESISGIIEAINRIQNDENLLPTLAKKGYHQAQRYSWRTMMEQTLDVYAQQSSTAKKQLKKQQ